VRRIRDGRVRGARERFASHHDDECWSCGPHRTREFFNPTIYKFGENEITFLSNKKTANQAVLRSGFKGNTLNIWALTLIIEL
jgi:hypothetical protein